MTPERRPLDFESIENILAQAFAPVEPPERLYEQFEARLAEVSLTAAEELADLADWELATMRDPRNWVRPAAALAVGGAAAGALVVLGWRNRHQQSSDQGSAAVKALTDAIGEAAEGARDEIVRSARDEIKRAARDFKS